MFKKFTRLTLILMCLLSCIVNAYSQNCIDVQERTERSNVQIFHTSGGANVVYFWNGVISNTQCDCIKKKVCSYDKLGMQEFAPAKHDNDCPFHGCARHIRNFDISVNDEVVDYNWDSNNFTEFVLNLKKKESDNHKISYIFYTNNPSKLTVRWVTTKKHELTKKEHDEKLHADKFAFLGLLAIAFLLCLFFGCLIDD